MVRWNHVTFTTTHNLRLELKALGFIENGPWKWQPAQQWDTLFDSEDQKTLDLTEGTPQTLGLCHTQLGTYGHILLSQQ